MQTVKVIIQIEVKADTDDEESVRQAVYDRLTEDMEAEELEFEVVENEDEDDYE
jgi:hypothetical protein